MTHQYDVKKNVESINSKNDEVVDFIKNLPFLSMGAVSIKKIKGLMRQHVISKIVVIGCGGTGSWLAPKLTKTINDIFRKNISSKMSLVFVDGDTVNLNSLTGRV